MNASLKSKLSRQLNKIVIDFEKKQLNSQRNQQEMGTVYTPLKLTYLISKNIIKIYLIDLLNVNHSMNHQYSLDFETLKKILTSLRKEYKIKIWKEVSKIKILDPSCGSGRFLVNIAENLLEIFKILQPEKDEDILKYKIINQNIFGVEVDYSAFLISKVRLLEWYTRNLELQKEYNLSFKYIKKYIESISKFLKIQLRVYHLDYLTEFSLNNFNIIVGNPPYIENKKINDLDYKKKLKKFQSAYGLFDISVIFLEKSIDLLNRSFGYISFLITNKFLAADYGKKIRKKILSETQILQIFNVSSLSLFKHASTYPIIISISKKSSFSDIHIGIFNSINMNDILGLYEEKNLITYTIPQKELRNLPLNVIPISPHLKLIKELYEKYKKFSNVFEDLIILYRPFGFINWAENFLYVNENKKTNKDLIVLGTGNVGKYHIKFERNIRIANRKLEISYFNYTPKFSKIWPKLQLEKLLIREIAKEITVSYDPGVYTNITGLYFVIIPSFGPDQYFSLLTILNSELMNKIFQSLYGTLHMAGGYLRYNGSFIKRLPIPSKIPKSLSRIGRILQFLYQFKYDFSFMKNRDRIKSFNMQKLVNFNKKLSNIMVDELYMNNRTNMFIEKLPSIDFKYFLPRFELDQYDIYEPDEINHNLEAIIQFYNAWKNKI